MWGQQLPDALEEVAVAAGDPDDLRALTDHDGQRHAEQEADQGGFGQEVGDEAEPGDTGHQQHRTGDDRQRGGEPDRELGVAADRADGGTGQDGGGRGRADDQQPGAAQQRVGQQCDRGGVEGVLRRDTGDLRIGDALRHDQRPGGQRAESVAAQQRRAVAAEPVGDRPGRPVGAHAVSAPVAMPTADARIWPMASPIWPPFLGDRGQCHEP
jgi:hypothetical protein